MMHAIFIILYKHCNAIDVVVWMFLNDHNYIAINKCSKTVFAFYLQNELGLVWLTYKTRPMVSS